ncbi:acetoin utilization deacetylase AcuC-like enzyme [Methylobacterium brachiatum]|jgi:acetoin utilization deacetylase AcuC-like enzyme|uniref:Acetoin utilization deacetylase AcuC-like enzyme n=1 Tax=Methylobacterium brachiatum TaxID=269660 RepID=A0AAJ1TNH9_9HYPH|nr:histone deacetylase family protein [Methylobacterium brachiatum]MCB4805983.1 histone deacetylase family protein [Methylobacterium brachiatum]MDQ0544175.1 acetoin utilization deacetylase AcuC-like enzyme [Methylobacterium brachiatum]
MRVFHTAASARHDPELYLRRGTPIPHPEQASRYAILHAAARDGGHALAEPADYGLDPIRAVHDAGYVAFLAEAWTRRAEIPGLADEILTGSFARPQMHRTPASLLGRVGLYTADTSTPIRAGTWAAVYGAAQCAVAAADAALEAGHAYALCRPPGHHAYADSAGGFCFLNNSGIAARRMLASAGGPVAILDIDVHHGNGTQGIFYASGDVLTVSVHADPSDYFPFYAGYADETGAGAGAGLNRNLPLPPGSGDGPWLAAVEAGLAAIAALKPRGLVVALGLDAAADDPIGVLTVTQAGFAAAAQRIARAGLPTALVQEGGYLCPALPENLTAFLAAFDAAR